MLSHSLATTLAIRLEQTNPLRPAEDVQADSELLSTDERLRVQHFLRPELRNHYLQVRASLRRCLALYTGLSPNELHFTRTPSGKPQLSDNTQNLSFNLSHSSHYLALAIGQGLELGIDLEQPRRRRNWRAIADRYFHQQEHAWLHTLSDTAGEAAFYRLWTLKEAFFKARGSGISAGLQKAAFSLQGNRIHSQFAPELEEQPADWHFSQWRWMRGDDQHGYLALAYRQTTGISRTLDPVFHPPTALEDWHLQHLGQSPMHMA